MEKEVESSQKQHNEFLRFETERQDMYEKRVFTTFKVLEPKLYKDGSDWCCLLGENIQTGVCGFGKSPYLAMVSFHNSLMGSEG